MGTFSVECIVPCGRKWSDVLKLMHKAPTKTRMCSTALCTALHCTRIQHTDKMLVCFSLNALLLHLSEFVAIATLTVKIIAIHTLCRAVVPDMLLGTPERGNLIHFVQFSTNSTLLV